MGEHWFGDIARLSNNVAKLRGRRLTSATQIFYGGDYPTAEKLFTALLPEAEKFHPRDRSFAELLSMLGTSYSLDHKPEQAEPALKRALQVYATISPADLLGTERAEDNLGGIYLEREDYPPISIFQRRFPFPKKYQLAPYMTAATFFATWVPSE